ncbi:MAG: helix-turn-helix domain-containing protein, partial [Dermatophilaceae bacterium]
MSATAPRPYRSQLRETQARATRRSIVEAATRLFLERGYAATTIDAVAEAAGVSRRTVFQSAGGKAQLLKLAWDWSLVGDDEPVPMAERPMIKRISAQTDPEAAIALWAKVQTEVAGRAAAIAHVLEAAADVDSEAAELLALSESQSRYGAAAFAGFLGSIGGLRPGLSEEEATDIGWVHLSFTAYRRLVGARGWSPERFERWLARSLT